ncbi:cwf21 domain-containing protein [Coniochaeta sp. 2T2.1]|nr:cwf21 domain-containing protein [Coniochaeta sp. 2T2.1]
MSDNVGLSTPRGSGTSGYVQKNLAAMRPRDRGAPYSSDLDNLREYKQRVPDKGILEHDRKREVEVKVFELRDKLEEEGVDEEVIDERCDELRKKLLADMDRPGVGKAPPRKGFKMHQVHELADQKIKESERLRQALKINKNYEEGSHWKRKEERLKKQQEAEANTDKEREERQAREAERDY